MKNRKLYLCVTVILALILSGCAPVVDDKDIPENYNIYASFLPSYMLSDLVIGENVPGMKLHLLIQPQDGCMRSYNLSDWDAYMAMNADAVILIGNGFETFESALMGLGENGPSVISASSSLVLDSTGYSENEESHLNGANPWLFLSVSGAYDLTEAIAANMIALDPDYEEIYIKNLNEAYERFEKLKNEIALLREKTDSEMPVALAHEGLGYIANDFGLNVVAQIDRESGAYPEDGELKDMLRMLSESGAQAVLIEKQAPNALLRAFEEAGYIVVLIDTLSAGTGQMGGEAYFERMLENARAVSGAIKK